MTGLIQDETVARPAAAVRIALYLFVAVLSLGAIEASCALFFHLSRDRFVFTNRSDALATPEELAEGYRTVYDRDLGWVFDHGSASQFGERPNSHDISPTAVAVFGTSYAYGGEVLNDETWPYYLSLILDRGVLNFGQTLYSTDQSLLHFEQKARQGILPPVTILTVLGKSIDGDVNVYKKFYLSRSQMAFTKPRFVLQSGQLVLLPNPITSASDRQKLTDPIYVRSLGRYDYWYDHNDLPELRFPYSQVLLSKGFWRQTSFYRTFAPINENNAHPATSLWSDPAISELSLRIIIEFFDTAQRYGTKPVLLYLPYQDEVFDYVSRGIEPLAMTRIAAECQQRHLDCLFPLNDSVRVFGKDPSDKFAAGGHYNPAGNMALASWLAGRLGSYTINRAVPGG